MAKYVLEGVNYGRNLDAAIPLAPNFKYWEFVSSVTAVRNNIHNIPTEAEWKNIENIAVNICQPLRNKVGGITISSGFRCKELNDLQGSSDASFHRGGGAVDLEPTECSLMQLLEEANKLHYSEIIAEYFPNGWVHIGYIKGDDRKMLKLKDSTHNFTRVTIEELRKFYPKG